MFLDSAKQIILPKVGAAKLTANKYSPELLLAGGLVAGIAAVVTIARAHKHSDAIVDEYILEKEDIELELEEEAEANEGHNGPVDEDIRRKAMLPAQMRLVGRLTRAYGPGVVMGVTSVGLILASHNVQSRRIKALGTALAIVQSGFATYRARVRAEMGEEADERFYYGSEERPHIDVYETEEGKLKKKKGKRNHHPEELSPIIYQRVWDHNHHRWVEDSDMNEFILRSSQDHMNNRLHIYGHVFLNEVYKDLGYELPNYGQAVGWSLHKRGDDFISYGLDDDVNQREGDNRWVLDFNVNGYILDDDEDYHNLGT